MMIVVLLIIAIIVIIFLLKAKNKASERFMVAEIIKDARYIASHELDVPIVYFNYMCANESVEINRVREILLARPEPYHNLSKARLLAFVIYSRYKATCYEAASYDVQSAIDFLSEFDISNEDIHYMAYEQDRTLKYLAK